MNIAVIGLGRMGNAVVERIAVAGHTVFGYDPHEQAREAIRVFKAQPMASIEQCVASAQLIWLMTPAGPLVDTVLESITPAAQQGAIIVDGGNSFFKDSIRRAKLLESKGLHFLDCGTSGGVHGRENGFCLMVGGSKEIFTKIEPVLRALAAPGGYALLGPSGAGHYVKMVHNGIEYALLQAYAEGFQIVKEGSFADQHLDLAKISDVWMHGSVIRSWLLELAHGIFMHDQNFESIGGEVAQGGTGAWTFDEAGEHGIQVPALLAALEVRAWSQESGGNYATKLIALLRNAFGEHAVNKIEQN